MESALSQGRREDVWEALSEAFNDNEVHYAFIAEQVAGVPKAELERIFFNEVAPQCAFNVYAVIPPVWTGFDRASLSACIRAMQVHHQKSWLARFKHRIAVTFYRISLRSYWKSIEAELSREAVQPDS